MTSASREPLSADAERALAIVGRMTRRDFLRFSALAGLAAATAGSAVGLPAGEARAASPLPHLNDSETAVFQKLLDAALPHTPGSALVPAAEVPVLATLDAALLATMAPHILTGLKEGIAYFNQGPVERFGQPFTALTPTQAAEFCDAWADAAEPPRRALAFGLKKLVCLAYWANPPTWAPLGYDGPVSAKWGLQARGNAPLPTA